MLMPDIDSQAKKGAPTNITLVATSERYTEW